jgi:hypothetical protein
MKKEINMCMFCAAVPVAGAVGAKLNADQKRKNAQGEISSQKPITTVTTGVIFILVVGSLVYHTTLFGRY